MSSELYEKLGLFYLGRQLDFDQKPTGLLELIKNDSFTTHAAIIGMTGSGKTGLGIGLLEEAAIDKIPALIIDPKGDMGNLLLAFDDLDPASFEPWIDPLEAKKKGLSPSEYAKKIAEMWREGIESYGQSPERIRRLKNSADFVIYTPGSSAGVPVNMLGSFAPPPPEVQEDLDTYSQILSSTTQSLLSLIDTDESGAAVLLSNIFDHYWSAGKTPTIEELIAAIINPPFKKIGVLSVESFYGSKKRMDLAMKLNALVGSPTFKNWLVGEPLDISRLLYTPEGKPRHAIFYLAHLGEKERIFFVARLLSELLAWMRRQSGTSALRALLYMDEIFGYFPPNANPPTKEPMLALLKQARAYGLGIVLSTQNPVDLDYKGLANIGTWFLGRLQTRQDIERVIDGLLKAGADISRSEIARLLTNLNKRVFLLRSIHKERLELFNTRWVLSYLKGPLSKDEVSRLMAQRKESLTPQHDGAKEEPAATQKATSASEAKPPIGAAIPQRYEIVDPTSRPPRFEPYIHFAATLHYYSATYDLDEQQKRCDELDATLEQPEFEELFESECREFKKHEPGDARYTRPAQWLLDAKDLKKIERAYRDHLYRTQRYTLYRCKRLRLKSRPGESYEEFEARVAQELRDRLDAELAKLQERYAKKMERLYDKLEKLQFRLQKEKEQAQTKTTDTILSVGLALFETFFGSRRSLSKASRAISKAKRAYDEYDDIGFIEEQIEDLKKELASLEEELEQKADELRQRYDISRYEITSVPIKPKKSEIAVDATLLWRQAL